MLLIFSKDLVLKCVSAYRKRGKNPSLPLVTPRLDLLTCYTAGNRIGVAGFSFRESWGDIMGFGTCRMIFKSNWGRETAPYWMLPQS
jgi:hypothetical protein